MLRRSFALCLLSCLGVCLFLSSCKKNDESSVPKETKSVTLTVWVPEEEKTLFEELVNQFLTAQKTNRPEVGYTIEVVPQTKDGASQKMTQNASAAADVFLFSSNSFFALIKKQVLAPITKSPDILRESNTAGAVKTVTADTDLYAYPLSIGDGEILYYNKAIFTKTDVESLNGMLEVLEKSNLKFAADMTNPRQTGGFFLGAGCKLTLKNEEQWMDFNTPEGLQAATALQTLAESVSFQNADEYTIKTQMGKSLAAAFGNVSLASEMKDRLGDNCGTATLPTFSIEGRETPIFSFMEYTLLGVNKSTKYPNEAMELAAFLTNQQSQLLRFQKYKTAPTNRNTAADPEIRAEQAVSALVSQSEQSLSLDEVTEDFWKPMNEFGAALIDGRHKSDKALQELLNDLVNRVME